MLLIADSGSTKTDWRILREEEPQSIRTPGINPYFHGEADILHLLQKEWPSEPAPSQIEQIQFYGAGTSTISRQKTVQKGLAQFFTQAQVNVHHDLLGAARATCQQEPGIVAILGTGSNTCYYDGEKIQQEHGGHGYILSDEGSGNHLGKELLNAYLDQDLPPNLHKAFNDQFQPDREEIIQNVYQRKNASRYLAKFAKFLSQHQSDPFVHNLVAHCFVELFNKHITNYDNYQQLPFHSVGSIGYHFKKILKEVAKQKHVQVGQILQDPIENLVHFHKNPDD